MAPLSLVLLPGLAYQLLALFAALRFGLAQRTTRPDGSVHPGVSVLKPVRGLDPNTYPAFVSQANQDYPQFEILFGVRDSTDPAIPEIHRLQRQFPQVDIRLISISTDAPNAKVGTLIELGEHAKYPIWVVNDSDIKVDPQYLHAITGPLTDARIGVVTCPYRAWAHSPATAWEALGIASDFMLSVFVAQTLGVRDFGLGATLAFRADDLRSAGGFQSLSDYLADDYHLAKAISGIGKRTLLSSYVVETSLDEGTWSGVWNHQLRWARAIRTSKGLGYLGLPITHAGLWIMVAFLLHSWFALVLLVCLRCSSALVSSLVLANRAAARYAWLAPVWDVYAFAVWVTSYCSNQVRWRDRVLSIDASGRIVR